MKSPRITILAFALVAAVLLISGCQTPTLYDFGKYSHTYYSMENKQTDESRAEHIAELTTIVEKSAKANRRPPPGVLLELGYYYAQMEEFDKAESFYTKELEFYPEAQRMVDFLRRNQSPQ